MFQLTIISILLQFSMKLLSARHHFVFLFWEQKERIVFNEQRFYRCSVGGARLEFNIN